MLHDRDVEQEKFELSESREVKLDDTHVPLYVRAWCREHCEDYGGCGWLRENCRYYTSPQWHKTKEASR